MKIGIDLGGTKIEIIVLDDAGKECFRKRIPSPRDVYEHTLDAIEQLILEAEAGTGPATRIGIGIPGTLSVGTGRVKNANSTWLTGHPLQQDLQQRLKRHVQVANDANCFVLSESRDGAAQGMGVVFGVILGTGAGGGLCIKGQIIEGANGIGGEWGHNPLPWPEDDERPGRACYCGQQGCIETWLSGSGLEAEYLAAGGVAQTAKAIAELAVNGDELANRILEQYEDRLARSLAGVINILDPEVIVLGGGLSRIKRLYQNVPRRWKAYVFSDSVNTLLLPPMHGDASGVRGAAFLT